eukprot:348233-Rhodomonas_salina.1
MVPGAACACCARLRAKSGVRVAAAAGRIAWHGQLSTAVRKQTDTSRGMLRIARKGSGDGGWGLTRRARASVAMPSGSMRFPPRSNTCANHPPTLTAPHALACPTTFYFSHLQ